jgi:rhamnosyltransferase
MLLWSALQGPMPLKISIVENMDGDPKSLPVAPRKENICAVVVTYFPDEGFSNRLSRIYMQVGHVIVVDNASDEETFEHVQTVVSDLGIDVIRNSENLGIATALNQGARLALEKEYDWTLFLDQDTIPAQNMVPMLTRAYDEFPGKNHLAIIGSSYAQDLRSDSCASTARSWVKSKIVITSGSLVSLKVLSIVGFFRDEFFIDCVDLDFCLRARSMGFEIIEVTQPVMQHFIGHATAHRLLFAETETSNHAPWRWYYMTRNHMALVREYLWKDPAWVLKAVDKRIRRILLMLFFEKSRIMKMKYLTIGLYDDIRGRFGRRFPVRSQGADFHKDTVL